MNDTEFLAAFEACTLPTFPHRDHIRMAWLYLRAYSWEEGMKKIREGIIRLAHAGGAPQKYHETMTVFWARIIQDAIGRTLELDDFTAFSAAHPHLFDSRLAGEFYSRDLLFSDAARHGWVEPDLQPEITYRVK